MKEITDRPSVSLEKSDLIEVKYDPSTQEIVGLNLPSALTGKDGQLHLRLDKGESFLQLSRQGIDEVVNSGLLDAKKAAEIKDRMSGNRASFIVNKDHTLTLLQEDPRYLKIKSS